MTQFDVSLNTDKLGIGLSKGELIQWLLDLSNELNESEFNNMKQDFECYNDDFEKFLYNQKDNKLIKKLRFKDEEYIIIESHNPFLI